MGTALMNGTELNHGLVGLLTDFGLTHYVAQMKAVMLSVCPTLNVIDISHNVPKQDVTYAAVELLHCLEAFPKDSWIIAVVDPGVGTSRPMILAEIRGVRVLAPDNGLITLIARKHRIDRLIELSNREFWRQSLSSTFEGRDILASVVGQASRRPEIYPLLGKPLDTYQQLEVPEPQLGPERIAGHILYIDSFGNAITNVTRSHVAEVFGSLDVDEVRETSRSDQTGPYRFKIEGITAMPAFVKTYGVRPPGSFIALIGSSQYLEFALTNGNAARQVGLQRNQRFEVVRSTARSITSILSS
jgi:S-adenosyl-L-methionine hydrolase (adenosine-forming)